VYKPSSSNTPRQYDFTATYLPEGSDIVCGEVTKSIQIDNSRICYTGNAAKATDWCSQFAVGSDAACCTGTQACDNWVGDATICQGSCKGDRACYGLSDGAFVGLSSCTSNLSCYWSNGSPPDSTIIQDGACKGSGACRNIATDKGKSLLIESNACVGYRSSYAIGKNNADSVTIQSEACVGFGSCYVIGYYNAESVRIDAGACDRNNRCSSFKFIAGDVQCFAENTGGLGFCRRVLSP
jgi:hypothetical protein